MIYCFVYMAFISEQIFDSLFSHYMYIFNIKTIRVLSCQNCITSTITFLLYLIICLSQFFSIYKQLSQVCSSLLPTPRTLIKSPITRVYYANAITPSTVLNISSVDKACLAFLDHKRAL